MGKGAPSIHLHRPDRRLRTESRTPRPLRETPRPLQGPEGVPLHRRAPSQRCREAQPEPTRRSDPHLSPYPSTNGGGREHNSNDAKLTNTPPSTKLPHYDKES